jgi:outer membrane immunogenic protein
MNHLFFGSVALLALVAAGPAVAADMPVKAPVYKAAPAYVPAFSWTGCYIGAHVGYGWGPLSWFDVDPDTDGGGDEPLLTSHKQRGAIGGGQVGCNYQVSSFLLGIEGDIAASNVKGKSSVTTDDGVSIIYETKIHWLATLALRGGLVYDRFLIYGKGGFAFARSDYKWLNNEPNTFTASDTRTGWLVGIGGEYALTNNWTAKVEYNYIDLGNKDIHGLSTDSDPTSGPEETYRVKTRLNVIKAGLNYKFDWGAPLGKGPVVTRY